MQFIRMTSTKELLRTGFHRIWRPHNGKLSNLTDIPEQQYMECVNLTTVKHLDTSLKCFRNEKLEAKIYKDFSVLESKDINAVCFYCDGTNSENGDFDKNTFYDQSSHGGVKLMVDAKYMMNNVSNWNIYFIEVIDMDFYSVARLLITTAQYETFPKLDIYTRNAPLYQDKNKLYCLSCHENYVGKIVKYIVEIIIEDEVLTKIPYWNELTVSAIKHEGHRRFKCKRVLDREKSICMLVSKEDCLAGIIAWMVVRKRLNVYNKFDYTTKRRLSAVHSVIKTKYPPRTPVSDDDDSQMSISDIECESENSSISTENSLHFDMDTKLNAVCDYIANTFYSSNSSIDVTSLQCALENCDFNVTFPTKTEIMACLVLVLKSVNDPLLLYEEEYRRKIILGMIPCVRFIKQKYQSLPECKHEWCVHDDYIKCPDVERTLYGYLLYTLERWQNEDSQIYIRDKT
ncbi:Hypothetical predicted protein [Mytilus galloprovincialis]|uniref:Uncharacterized protein n=2 Tax=Mytilus galloprovincialis TaxID=29158 RepID=A0A8B6FP12_MYTGA|nr:Hypothetical predicted protein [Mytilus galloprovincialis]